MKAPPLALLLGVLSCSGSAADGPGEPGPPSEPAPFVVSASPALDETSVYPAPLWLGNGEEVAIELTFSEGMALDPGKSLVLESDDHQRSVTEVVWSDDRRQLTLFVRPDFTSIRPLADESRYALDLSSLVSASGRQLEPSVGLRERRLVFSTGRYDPLLNHSCGHTFFGPFASLVAGATGDASAPDISTTHTEYSISKQTVAGGYSGFVRANFPLEGPYRLYFDREATITMLADGEGTALALERSARACPGITHEVDLMPRPGDPLFFRLGPDATAKDRLIVELVPQE